MNFLNVTDAIAILRVRSGTDSKRSLSEQADGFVRETPHLIVDLRNSPLSSMLVGDLVNLRNAARERWGERFPGLHLTGLSEQARNVIVLSRLEQIMPIHPTVDSAIEAIGAERRKADSAAAS